MSDDARWVRPAFLSLAALFGLIVMVWGLVTGALGAFHIYEPRYGRAEADQGDVANAFRSVYAPLLELGQSQGTAPPGSEDAFRRAAADVERQALDRAKDRGYNEAVGGALAFVVGGFVLLVGSSGAKRAADRAEMRSTAMGAVAAATSGSPRTAEPAGKTQPPPRAPARPAAPRQRPTAPPPPPARAATSPVGRLQEAPDATRRAAARRPAAPAPKPATRRPTREGAEQAPAPPAPPRPAAAPVPVTPARPVSPPPQPAQRVAPARPVAPPSQPARPMTPPPAPSGGDDGDGASQPEGPEQE